MDTFLEEAWEATLKFRQMVIGAVAAGCRLAEAHEG